MVICVHSFCSWHLLLEMDVETSTAFFLARPFLLLAALDEALRSAQRSIQQKEPELGSCVNDSPEFVC